MAKITREKFKTFENVFDNFTMGNLFKLQNRGYFEMDTLSPIFIGKESNVFSAKTKEGKKIIVKIYRLETSDFNKMYDYIKYDSRYVKLKKRRRDIIFSWTQREFRNLMTAREANCTVPLPLTFMHNILLLEFIGTSSPAPQMKDSVPETKTKLAKLLKDVIKNIHNLYKKGLVHGDLSAFNILYHKEKPVIIDFSQSTTTKSERADELLERDCKNIAHFFTKHGLEITTEELVKQITK